MASLLLVMMGFVSACKKVTHEIDDEIVSINESTVSAIQVGKTLNVGFISNKVNSIDFSIVKDGASLLSESIVFGDNERIVSKDFAIPNDEAWVGEALLTIKYTAAGQQVEKTKAITFEESNPVMFAVGGSIAAGWEPTLAIPMSVFGEDSKTTFELYEYITVAGDGFKFLPTNANWDDAYGKGATAGTLLQTSEAGNISVTEDAFYRIQMDSENLSYELLKLNFGLIGSATPGGWDADTDMTFAGGKGTYVWKTTLTLVPGAIKFRANDDWVVNFGGTEAALTAGGADINITAGGTYTVELHLTPGNYHAVLTKQ